MYKYFIFLIYMFHLKFLKISNFLIVDLFFLQILQNIGTKINEKNYFLPPNELIIQIVIFVSSPKTFFYSKKLFINFFPFFCTLIYIVAKKCFSTKQIILFFFYLSFHPSPPQKKVK